MIKPYVCVACEKAIVAKDDVASLIGLFSKITIATVPGIEILPNAVVPREWTIFSIWDIEPGDELKAYVLCTSITYPDRSQFGELNKIKMNIEANKRSQMVVNVPVFPIGQLGDYVVRTWVEEKDSMVVGPIEFKIRVEAQATPPVLSPGVC